ncbi:Hypothetical Protein NTJ_05099 [Nesidiocoris tenuis]|nr:Hypothetical Protein NTJ_05099 [Nesidiocoris tenuis]
MEERLAQCLFAYRNTPNTVTGKSPADMLLSHSPRTHLSMLSPKDQVESFPDERYIPQSFEINQKVLVKNPHKGIMKWLPGRVMSRVGRVVYLAKLIGGAIRKCHVNQMRLSGLPDSAHPERRDLDWWRPERNGQAVNGESPKRGQSGSRSPVQLPRSPRPQREKHPPKRFSHSAYD